MMLEKSARIHIYPLRKKRKEKNRKGRKRGKKDLTIYSLEEEEYVTFISLSCEARIIFIPKPDKNFTRK